jgi:hypothetical protein
MWNLFSRLWKSKPYKNYYACHVCKVAQVVSAHVPGELRKCSRCGTPLFPQAASSTEEEEEKLWKQLVRKSGTK